jgi:predicted alpha/beta hydrolase
VAERIHATTPDGWRLGGELHLPPGRTRGVVLLLHAMMVDRRTMDRGGDGVVATLLDAGFAVLNADFRGRGLSGPTPKQGASWGYDDLVLHDVPTWVTAARDAVPGLPMALVGHSLGGHVSLATAGAGLLNVDAWVGFAANIWLPQLEPDPALALRKALSLLLFAAASVPKGRFPSRRARRGPADEAGPYVRDLCGFWVADRWRGHTGQDWLAGLQSIQIPCLSLLGAGDHLMGAPVAARHWAEHVPGMTVEEWGFRTGLTFDPGHMELVTDPRSRPAWARVGNWLHDVLPRPPRG